MYAFIPLNQPIVQALLDKADSFPIHKIYHAKAYRKAANNIAKLSFSLYDFILNSKSYDLDSIYIEGIGPKISHFIIHFTKTHLQTNKHVQSTHNNLIQIYDSYDSYELYL